MLADFDKYYWPFFKMIIEFFASHNVYVVPIYEGDWSRYYNHLQELPAKKTGGWFEHGDPKEMKQKLQDTMCIIGLFPATLLQYGTKEECIAKAKELSTLSQLQIGMLANMSKPLAFSKSPLLAIHGTAALVHPWTSTVVPHFE